MGAKRGKAEYDKFLSGKSLSRKEAIIAQCYVCNGEDEGGIDCRPTSGCPLYQYMPYNTKSKRILSPEEKKVFADRFAENRRKSRVAPKPILNP